MTFEADYGFGLTKTLVTTFMTLLLMHDGFIHLCTRHGYDELNALPENAEKRLILHSVSNPRFAFEVANTCLKKVSFDNDGYPVREDGTRGVRTQSIIAFAKRYDRVLVYDIENNMFWLRLIIQDEVLEEETRSLR